MKYFKHVTFRTVRIVTGVAGTTIITIHTLPHIIPTKTIEKRLALPSRKPGERFETLLKEVCMQMKIDPDKIRLFYSTQLLTISGGCLLLPGQSVIGLPRNCCFNAEEMKYAFISYDNKDKNWDSQIDKTIKDVLWISDEEVKFLIAHELVHIKEVHFIAKTLHATGFFLGSYLIGLLGASFMQRHLYRAIIVQCVIWAFGYTAYQHTRKMLCHWLEYEADEKAAKLGVDYSIGGIDYMQNRLKLNLILKENGLNGENLFSDEGNSLQTISTHPKRTDRIKRLEEIEKSHVLSLNGRQAMEGECNF